MSAVETVEATTPTGTDASTTADPQAGGTVAASDAKPEADPKAGQDQSKPATLLTEAEKPAEQAAPVVPEAYEIALPKESPVSPDALTKVTELAKSLSLTDSKAVQGLVDLIHAEAVAVMEAQQVALKKGGELWTQHVQRLESEALADADIGGTPERLQASVQKAKAALSQFAPDGFAEFLEESALGSDPRFIKFLVKVQKAMGEDTLIQGEPAKPKPKSLAQAIYPNLPSAEG